MPIISEGGDVLDITWPEAKIVSLKEWFNGKCRIMILRPAVPLTDEQKFKFVQMANAIKGQKYDLKSIEGAAENNNTQDPKKVQCAEGTLLCDKAMGLFPDHDGLMVSPRSYEEYTKAGLFKVIYGDSYPTPDDFARLVKG